MAYITTLYEGKEKPYETKEKDEHKDECDNVLTICYDEGLEFMVITETNDVEQNLSNFEFLHGLNIDSNKAYNVRAMQPQLRRSPSQKCK